MVRDAAIEADVGAHGDHTISADALNVALNRIAGEQGIDLQALAASNIVTPPVTGITPVPQDSGFVNDPVCTATGHLLVDATDFAMPARLAVLSLPAPVRLAGHDRRRVRAGLVVVGGRTRRHQRPRRVRAVRARRPPRHLRASWRRRVRDAAAPRRRCHHGRRRPAAPLGSPVPVLRPDVGLPSGAAARGRRALRRVDDVPPRWPVAPRPARPRQRAVGAARVGRSHRRRAAGRATGARRGSATTAGATSSTCATRCRRRPTTSTSRAASARSPTPTACRWWP